MRIVIPIHSFEPGGVERVALRLAERWQEAGHSVVIVLGRDDERRHKASKLDYRVSPCSIPTARFETLWMMRCLFHHLWFERTDVVFCPGNTYTIVCIVARLLLGPICPPILAKVSNDLSRSDFPKPIRFFYRLWLRLQGLMIDRMVGLAEPMRREIIREMAMPPARVSIIEDPALSAADFRVLSAIERPDQVPSNKNILAVGRLVPQKNYAMLIESFAKHSWPDDHLTIAGEGPEGRRLENLAKNLGVAARITFAGHRDDIKPMLAEADIFALSSDYEGVPAVIIEALAAGLPIVATDCCVSMQSLLGYGKFGIIVPVGDADQLGLALNNIAHKRHPVDEARRLSRRFTLECASTAYLGAFEELAGGADQIQEHNFSHSDMRELHLNDV